MNHFVGWDFFPVGGLNSLGQPSSARMANFQDLENETWPGSFLLDSRKWLEFLGLFARPFESPPALLPPDFDAMIFLLLGWTAAMKLPRIPGTFKDPANPSISLTNSLSAAEEIAQNPSKLPAKKSSGKIALTIEHFHDSSKQKRAIKNFRFVRNFSSSEFKIGCQVLFLTPSITHKIHDKNSLFSCSGMKMKSAGNF